MRNLFNLLLIVIFLNGCKKESPDLNEIFIQGSGSDGFNPSTLTVSTGTTIIWTNKERVIHTVTSNTGVFDSGDLKKGNKYTYTFTTAGTYPYYCKYHSAMKASIIVQ